jgi:hypothetical protein
MKKFNIVFAVAGLLAVDCWSAVNIRISEKQAVIENDTTAIVVNLTNGSYCGIDRTANKTMFTNAVMLVDSSITRQWKKPATKYSVERLEFAGSIFSTAAECSAISS